VNQVVFFTRFAFATHCTDTEHNYVTNCARTASLLRSEQLLG